MDTPTPRISPARRAAIRDFLETRNATTAQLARRFFPSSTPETARKKTSRWLAKQRKRKRIRVRGVVYFNAVGRPHVVYGQRCKEDQLEHEVWITEAELLLGGPFTRNVAIGKTVADAMLVRDGARFFVEVDNHTMPPKQMREKWVRYGKIDGFILVICHTKERLRRLMRGAELVKSVALFTRFRWLRAMNVKEPWIDWYRKRARI
jgi:hypothetical protein